MDRQAARPTGGQAGGRTSRRPDIQVDRQANRQAGAEQTGIQTGGRTGKQPDRQAVGQTGGQADGQTGGRTDRWADKVIQVMSCGEHGGGEKSAGESEKVAVARVAMCSGASLSPHGMREGHPTVETVDSGHTIQAPTGPH